jgi:hypothetical protein
LKACPAAMIEDLADIDGGGLTHEKIPSRKASLAESGFTALPRETYSVFPPDFVPIHTPKQDVGLVR